MIEKEINEFIKIFDRIADQGWIPAIEHGESSIGTTFEALLGKRSDNLETPDYGSIEIKTHTISSKFYTSLFHLAPPWLSRNGNTTHSRKIRLL